MSPSNVCPDCGGTKANPTAKRCWECRWKAHRAERAGVICRVDGCDRPEHAKGYCKPHHRRLLKGAELDSPVRDPRLPNQPCIVDGCAGKRVGWGLCRMHYFRMWKHGDIGPAEKYDRSAKGHLDRKGYHCIRINGREYKVHRIVMERLLGRPLLSTETVHHVNGVKNDNRTNGPLVDFRSGNLELWSSSQPSGQRITDKVAWAVELLQQYAPELLSDRPVQLRLVT